MNQTSRTIAKNASVLFASQVTTWGLSLVIMIFLSRYLGATGIGQIHLANSIWAIMTIVIEFGMDTHLTKEISRKPEQADNLIGVSLVLRATLFVVSLVVVFIYLQFANYAAETIAVIFVTGFSNLVLQLGGVYNATLRGLERMEYISLADVVGRSLTAIVTITLLLLNAGIIPIVAVGILAAFVSLSIQFAAVRRLRRPKLHFNWDAAKLMLQKSFSYLVVGMFLVLYMQVDIIVISLLVNETGVGWYGAADQLFGTFLFIPSIFMTAVFPVLSRMYANSSDSLPRLMSKSFNLLMLLSVPIGLGVVIIANPLVVLLFGEDFANSGPILAVMGIVIILTYQNMLLGQFFISIDRQKVWTWVMALATVATVALDIVLIPWCQRQFNNGAIGGSIAFVITEAGMLIAAIYYLPSGILTWNGTKRSLRAVLAGLGMVLVTWWFRDLFIAIPIAIGALSYIGFILLFRAISQEDWDLLKNIGTSIIKKLRGRQTQPAA